MALTGPGSLVSFHRRWSRDCGKLAIMCFEDVKVLTGELVRRHGN